MVLRAGAKISVKIRAILPLLLALGGCAHGATRSQAVAPVASGTTVCEEVHDTVRAHRERIRELEAAVALARAEANALRIALREAEERERTRATRIVHTPDEQGVDVVDEEPEESGPRPVLRLYGSAPAPIPGPPASVFADAPPPPPALRLPVAHSGAGPSDGVPAIPAAPVVVTPRVAPSPARNEPRPDPAAAAYREALAHVSARRFDEALAGLDAFLRANPDHAYADNAMYWRAEIHYARRDYRRALAEFTALVERYPRGNKVPEALLRIGLCHERMGDRASAQRAFERLRAEFPASAAARMASREDA